MKNKLKVFWIIFLLVIGYKVFGPLPSAKTSPIQKVATRILSSQSKSLKLRHGLVFHGTVTSLYDGIRKLGLSCHINRKLSKDEGRAIVIDCVNQMIRNVNASPDAQPFFLKNGFSDQNVEFSLYTRDPNGVFYPDIRSFSFFDGKILYGTIDKQHPNQGFLTKEFETYEEAVAILKKQGYSDILLENSLKEF